VPLLRILPASQDTHTFIASHPRDCVRKKKPGSEAIASEPGISFVIVLLDFAGGTKIVYGVGLFPGELGEFAAEVAVVGGCLEDGTTQVQALQNVVGAHVEDLSDSLGQLFVGDLAGAA